MNLLTSLLLKRASGLSMSSEAVNFLYAMVSQIRFPSRSSAEPPDPDDDQRDEEAAGENQAAPAFFQLFAGHLDRVTRGCEQKQDGVRHRRCYLLAFAPYLLRLRLRPSTPSASSVPRTM